MPHIWHLQNTLLFANQIHNGVIIKLRQKNVTGLPLISAVNISLSDCGGLIGEASKFTLIVNSVVTTGVALNGAVVHVIGAADNVVSTNQKYGEYGLVSLKLSNGVLAPILMQA